MNLSDKSIKFITNNPDNPFCLTVDEYKRDVNPLSQYFAQLTFYLSKMTGDSEQQIRDYYKKTFTKNGIFEIKDPTMTVVKTKDNGDREVVNIKLSKYISECVSLRRIISPTLTVYENPKVKNLVIKPCRTISFEYVEKTE